MLLITILIELLLYGTSSNSVPPHDHDIQDPEGVYRGIPVEPDCFPYNNAHLFDPEVLKAGGYETLDKGEATDAIIIGLLGKFMAQQRSLQQLI